MATVQSSVPGWAVRPAPGVVRIHLDHLRDPIGHFDLPAMERELRRDPAIARDGHSAVTLVKYPDLRVVLLALRKGGSVAESRTEARISLQALRGHLEVHLPDGPIDLAAGSLATLEGNTSFRVDALTDSALLLTLSWPGRGAPPPTAD